MPTQYATNPVNPTNPAAGAPTTAPQPSIPTEEQPTYNEKLNACDRYWKFKLGLKAVLIITGLIGIGCFGWLTTTAPSGSRSYYDPFSSFWVLWPSFGTWTVSVLWCLLCIVLLLVRKRPVHPGVRVTLNLLLWLGFLVTALFATSALYISIAADDLGVGLSGGLSTDGGYTLADNGTWVWEQDTSYISTPRDCTHSGYTFASFDFADCAEQDAYFNKIMSERPRRHSVNLAGVVCQWMDFVLYFAMLVWSCVDTHRYRRAKVSQDAERMAADIVQKMVTGGAVVSPPGQTYVKPTVGPGYVVNYQVPHPQQQAYQQQGGIPGQQQQRNPQGQYPMRQQGMAGPALGAVGPSGEKTERERFA
jgi:hypothetical protein